MHYHNFALVGIRLFIRVRYDEIVGLLLGGGTSILAFLTEDPIGRYSLAFYLR